MSWIFGVIDPAGVDHHAVLRAAGRPLGHLEPSILASAQGVAVFGAFCPPGSAPGVVATARHLVAADARVDAINDIDLGSVEGAAATSAIADVIAERGPRGLDDLAADFAVAHFDAETGTLLLTRDATGNRPLFWGERGQRLAFSSDPRFLIRSGLSTGDIDVDVCATYLAGLRSDPRRTGIRGIHRVLGGRWIELGVTRRTGGRWFRPELDHVDPDVTSDAKAGVRASIRTAVRDRARAGPVGVLLSGGRDSGSIAMALSQEGVSADCFTMTFDPKVCPSEDKEARSLADDTGHRWTAIRQSTEIVDDDMRWLLDRTPFPIGYPFATSTRANHEAVLRSGARMLMEGYGGELFVAGPLATLDVARSLKPLAALRSARAFDHRWVYPYAAQAKGALRAMLPKRILSLRDRSRRLPPWARVPKVLRSPDPMMARTARDYRVRFLLWEGTNPVREGEDAVSFPDGVRTSYPFYDRRVIRAALRLPAEALIPYPEPKWILTEGLLGRWSSSRVKANQEAWFRELARGAWVSHAEAFSEQSVLATRGLVNPTGLRPPFDPRFEVPSSALVFMDASLRFSRDPPKNKPKMIEGVDHCAYPHNHD